MKTSPLTETAYATVGANGIGRATLQPLRAFERWKVTKITVQNSGSVKVPCARVYKNGVLVEGTYTGTLDSSDTNIELENGEQLICVWEGRVVGTAGADVGSICTFTIQGERQNGV